MVTRVPVKTKDDLSLAYTPGVAQPCLEIQKDPSKSYELTRRWNMAAVITDGSAVLGLGDIGPEAGMPVMEGKCVLFKAFGDVDAFPICVKTKDVDEFVETVYNISGSFICVKTKDVDEFVETVYNISGSFGGINLEDIAAPRCFEIERKLKEKCDIPIFHDDQHGTAVITLAGLTNALKVVGKKKEDVKVVTSGAGAAAIAITKLLLSAGFRDITMCDRKGAIYKGREGLNWIKTEMTEATNLSRKAGTLSGAGAAAIAITKLLLSAGFKDITMCDRKGAIYQGREGLNWIKTEMAEVTNLSRKTGTLADMLVGADVFIGVSAPNTVTTEMVKTMNRDAIIFACANPTPEIFPDAAKAGGARVISTGRSDYPNQINNVLAFPGIFRGAFDVRASDINEAIKVAAAEALAGLVGDELSEDYIIPAAFDPRVGPAVAKAVAEAARRSGVARI
ncbi:malic enzyme [Firmicutes bacterium CAG:129]|nr:malic enzyme [Firmicutes bacterium CAG:129]